MGDLNKRSADVSIHNSTTDAAVTTTTDGAKERLDVSNVDVSDPKSGNFTNVPLTNGGSSEMNVDGSSTPVSFTAAPPTNKNIIVYRLLLVMEDASMSWKKFGGIAALTNGVDIKVTEDGTERTISTDPIKTNRDYVWNCYDVEIDSATTDVLRMRWTFSRAGTVLVLKDSFSDNFKIVINDDVTGVDYYKATIQGYEVDE
jgi:hypothetical protein